MSFMKKIFSVLSGIIVLAVSCVNTGEVDTPAPRRITISASLSDVLTKVAFTPQEDASGKPVLSLTWETGDVIRVYNHADRTQYQDFTLDPSCDGQKNGVFSGEAITASSYDIEVLGGDFDCASQTQPSDGVTADLKYFASVSGAASYDTIEFTEFSSVLGITAKLPAGAAAGIKSVDITASEDIFNGGNTLTVTLATPGDAGNDGILVIYATLPAGSVSIPEGTSLLIRFNAPGTGHTVYTRYLELGDGLSFVSGMFNGIKVNFSKSDVYAGKTADNGSEATPYLIGDKYQMQAVRDLLVSGQKKHFKLICDVDLEGDAWTPLNNASPYDKYISLDGNGYTLSGLNVSGTTASSGLFCVLNGQVYDLTVSGASVLATTGASGILAGDLGNGGTEVAAVENVTLVDCNVGSSDFSGVAGGLAGNIRKAGTEIKDVTVSGCSITSKNNYVGGLLGYVRVAAAISGCRVTGSAVSGKDVTGGLLGCMGNTSPDGSCTLCFVENTTVNGSYRKVGGLAGIHDSGSISRCGVESDVTVTSPSYFVGGLIGYQQNTAAVDNCYSRAPVNAGSSLGGLVGEIAGTGTISMCFASGTPSGTTPGGLVGKIGSGCTVSKCISWNSSYPLANTVAGTASDCYTKASSESGTVSSHAQEAPRSWSDVIWDFSTPFPTLTDAEVDPIVDPAYAYHIIPYPNSLTPGEGSFSVQGAVVYLDSSLEGSDVVEQFASRLGTSVSGTSGSGSSSGINFLKDSSLGDEAYTIDVTPGKVMLKASSRAGVFYAVQTLKQLLPAEVYGTSAVTADWTLPCLSIEDEPRFVWRGMHLDVSRHFFTVDEIKAYLDIMAIYKLNRFHWHLTDDQGWRVEIEGDEALTRLGAYRGSSHPAYPGYDRDNGFYTKAQVAEIVEYAHERCITVVPEVDLPGHAASLLTAHNELGCIDKQYSVWTKFGINTELLCVAKATSDEHKDVLDNIIKQLALMFPDSEYIHIGGDETRTGSSYSNSWKTCPDCLALMESLGLTDETSVTKEARLQHYFTKYMHGLAQKYGKNIIGWQEIYVPIKDSEDFDISDLPGACIESWTQQGHGINAAKAGLKGLVAPSVSHYLSYPQSGADRIVTLNDCYTKTLNNADVSGCTPEQLTRFLGAEGCMWTESITSLDDLEFMLLPRLGAIAEVAWTQFANKDYTRLCESLTAKHFAIYDQCGYNYRSTTDF